MEVMRQEPKVRLPPIKELIIGLPIEQTHTSTPAVLPSEDLNYSYRQHPTSRQSSTSNSCVSPPNTQNSTPFSISQPIIPSLDQQSQTILLQPPTTSASSSRNGSLSGTGSIQVPPLSHPPLQMAIPPMHMQIPLEYQQQLQHHQTYSLLPNPNSIQHSTIVPKKKRPRRKANEMVRLYACNYNNCRNSYGTLNHLNAHITFKRHGSKRKPEEFKQIRELYKLKKKLSESTNDASKTSQEQEIRQLQASINADALKKSLKSRNLEERIQSQENIKLLANLSETLVDRTGQDIKVPVFYQQRGYNGYSRYDHTLTTNDLRKLPINN